MDVDRLIAKVRARREAARAVSRSTPRSVPRPAPASRRGAPIVDPRSGRFKNLSDELKDFAEGLNAVHEAYLDKDDGNPSVAEAWLTCLLYVAEEGGLDPAERVLDKLVAMWKLDRPWDWPHRLSKRSPAGLADGVEVERVSQPATLLDRLAARIPEAEAFGLLPWQARRSSDEPLTRAQKMLAEAWAYALLAPGHVDEENTAVRYILADDAERARYPSSMGWVGMPWHTILAADAAGWKVDKLRRETAEFKLTAGLRDRGLIGPGEVAQADPRLVAVLRDLRSAVQRVKRSKKGKSSRKHDGKNDDELGAPEQLACDAPDLAPLVARLAPSVVSITVQMRRESAIGSGWAFRDNLIVTNHHVVQNARRIEVKRHDGRVFEGHVVGSDPGLDLSVVRVEDADLPVVTLAETPAPVGERVLAIGSPMGLGWSATTGIISACGRGDMGLYPGGGVDFLQTDATIAPGSSGGPLFNLCGEVVGMTTASLGRGLGFAVPIAAARSAIEQIVGFKPELQRGDARPKAARRSKPATVATKG